MQVDEWNEGAWLPPVSLRGSRHEDDDSDWFAQHGGRAG
jgi:hypothetical protein